ncbi:MAG: hypothetical protein ACYDB3_10030, partial [Acidimicrobiales bacterium]
ETDVSASVRAILAAGSYTVLVVLNRPDLKTRLAEGTPMSFFVNGRSSVGGLADLGARFERCSEVVVAAPESLVSHAGVGPPGAEVPAEESP